MQAAVITNRSGDLQSPALARLSTRDVFRITALQYTPDPARTPPFPAALSPYRPARLPLRATSLGPACPAPASRRTASTLPATACPRCAEPARHPDRPARYQRPPQPAASPS